MEDHGGPEAGQLPRHEPEVVKKREFAKKRGVQRVRSWTVQNEMRSIQVWMIAGAVRRIPNSANSRKLKSSREGSVRCSEDESDEETPSSIDTEGTCVSEKFR